MDSGTRPHSLGYLIGSVPRSGSTALARALSSSGVLGHPEEYLNWDDEPGWASRWGLGWPDPDGHDNYIEAMTRAGTTPNGVFGIKIHADQALRVGRLRISDGVTVDPDGSVWLGSCRIDRMVHLRRRDKVGAALSEWRAEHTGQWVLMPGEEVVQPQRAPTTDEITTLHEYQHMWDRYWRGMRVAWPVRLEVWFEDLVDDFRGTVERTARFLGQSIEVDPGADLPLRQPDPQRGAIIERWVAETGGCAECGHGEGGDS